MAPPPTEASLLSTFLLPPAPLPAVVSQKAFTQLFPASQQSSPNIKALYRDLQSQRARLIDNAGKNIITETKRGLAQKRAVARAQRTQGREDQDDEVDVERALFGPSSNLPISKPHSFKSIIPEMESAADDLEDETRRLDEETEALMTEIKNTIGALSDLRYGRLANGQLPEQVLEGLLRLDSSCQKK